MRSKMLTKLFTWVLLIMLIVGLAGFSVVNFGGSAQSVGSVGDRDITVNAYARALQNELRATEAQFGQTLTFQQAQVFGVPQRVMSQLVVQTALDTEADRLVLSVDDETVAQEMNNIGAFKGPDGNFDRETYKFALKNAGYTEAEFENNIRQETARTVLQAAILAGNAAPSKMVDTVVAYYLEQRDISLTKLGVQDLQNDVVAPTDADLDQYYQDNIAQYTAPERKVITYAILTPEMVTDTLVIEDATLRAAYDARLDEFQQPERRLIDRLVFASQDQAVARKAEIEAGTTTFDDLVLARGLGLLDVDMGDQSRQDLGAIADPIFDAQLDAIVGPLDTDLGPALFRVNGVIAQNTTSFDEVKDQLFQEIAAERARGAIENIAANVDNELAAGATLEDLAKEFDMQLDEILYHAGSDETVAGYPAFRDAAQSVAEGDFPSVVYLQDGGIFALRLDGIEPAAPIPFAEVSADVEQAWIAGQEMNALKEMANTMIAENAINGEVDKFTDIRRNDVGQVLTRDLLVAGFELEPGASTAVTTPDGVVIVTLDAIKPADLTTDDAKILREQIGQDMASGISNDLFAIFATALQTSAGVTLDQQAINAVHANF